MNDEQEPQGYRTKSGRVLSDAEIEALADEAEQGYDVSHLHDQPDRRVTQYADGTVSVEKQITVVDDERPRNNQWKIIVAVCVIVAVIAVGIFIATSSGGSKHHPAATRPPADNQASTVDFEGALYGQSIYTVPATAAAEACSDIEGGTTATAEGFKFLGEYNLSPHDAGFVVGAAVRTVCPQYLSRVEQEVNG